MNTRYFMTVLFAVLLVTGASGPCKAQDQAAALTVKKIVFQTDKGGKENVSILCSQTCVPALSGIEGQKPRIVMDFSGVSHIDKAYRSMAVSGKHVKKIRSYLDPASKKLRVVLDMAPSKSFIAQASQEQAANTFSVSVTERRQKTGKGDSIKGSRITIVDRAPLAVAKAAEPEKTADKPEPAAVVTVAALEPPKPAMEQGTIEQGRSRMNAGNYQGAIRIFSQLIADNPNDSLPHRLRGNAYQSIGERQKAIEDWTAAARLGDSIIQSYLEHLQIDWKEAAQK